MLGRVPRGYIIKSDSSCNEGVDFVESRILMIKSIDGLIDLIHIIELSVQD